ncbi:uncharacterized protein LOC142983645 [Anticarsia gemmatalis]|uniref:uncharacterized protein LOC142983645 n=1 Tax=Anticarsia gemmatalis TaxID=129554 RepID=UPI003F766CA7
MSCEIVIRPARAEEQAARGELVTQGITSYDVEAIITFILQELMLQLTVLCGAVLFIFVGASLGTCCLAPLVLAGVAAAAVLLTHRATGAAHAARLRRELAGFVAEYRGPLGGDPRALRPRVLAERDAGGAAGRHARLVGTVSVAAFRGARRSGWLQALAVEPAWRRRGVGGALVDACRAWAAGAGLESLEAAASSLQTSARSLLHAHGWELRGTYHRQLVGTALTLPMLQLGLELPHA